MIMDSHSVTPLFEAFIWIFNNLKELNKEKLIDLLLHFPQYYSEWWQGLLKDSPLHLIIETSLCAFILWLLLIRKTVDPTKTEKDDKLTEKEINWLLETWNPEPLVPELTKKDKLIVDSMMV